MTITLADPHPTGELPRVTRSIPEQRYQPQTATPPAPVPAEPTDSPVRQLVERAQGDGPDAVAALAELYQRYVDMVFRFVFFRVKHRQLAEDITSATFERACRRIRSFQWTGTDFGAWLCVVARNQIADYFKSGRYNRELLTGDVRENDQLASGQGADPAADALAIIGDEQLRAAIGQLKPAQQEVLTLRFLRGYSTAETAQAMGKKDGAIKALQYRAVQALARILPAAQGGDHFA